MAARSLLFVLPLIGLAACTPFQAGMPGDAATSDPGRAVLQVAQARIGSPYKYGGTGPDVFDCSGLVTYAHRQVGVDVPRTAAEQFAAATPVKSSELRPGDLVFFRLDSRNVGHVGIYAGDNRFVHAPQRGGNVRMASLDDEWYRSRYAGAGRFYSALP